MNRFADQNCCPKMSAFGFLEERKSKKKLDDKKREKSKRGQVKTIKKEKHKQREQERHHKKDKGIQEHRHTKKETEEPRHIEAWVILQKCLFQGFSGFCKAREQRKKPKERARR